MADIMRSVAARPLRRANDRGPVREFLVFALAGELYGVELMGIKEILSPPRSLAQRTYADIRRWTRMPQGGHFAALEQPEALAREVTAFFGEL